MARSFICLTPIFVVMRVSSCYFKEKNYNPYVSSILTFSCCVLWFKYVPFFWAFKQNLNFIYDWICHFE